MKNLTILLFALLICSCEKKTILCTGTALHTNGQIKAFEYETNNINWCNEDAMEDLQKEIDDFIRIDYCECAEK